MCFTLVHKFQTPELLCDRSDVIVLTDEAHRSQYDTLALNMRAALPKAMFLAFTGTPLIAGEERTKEVFGDYVSIYDFQQSIEDGATVPLFYENRTPELQLVNPDLNDDLYRLIEDAELDPEQEAKLERELGRQYHLITRDDRLETVAQDIVRHFLGRGFVGKAMVVSIDKATALRHARQGAGALGSRNGTGAEGTGRAGLSPIRRRYDARTGSARSAHGRVETAAECADHHRHGADRFARAERNSADAEAGAGHRATPQADERVAAGLDEKFKDTDDPLRLVFVCAMWLTGFRRTELLDGVSGQAHAQPHADADHRPRQPRVSRQAQRRHRRLRQRLCLAGKGTGDLRCRQGREESGQGQAAIGRGTAQGGRGCHGLLRRAWRDAGRDRGGLNAGR
jgi:type I restriction enzyme R subunit